MKTVRIVIQTDEVDRTITVKGADGNQITIPIIDDLVNGLLTGLKEIGSTNTIHTIEREDLE